ncbi:MAG TPA: tetratricopeptide repeat protein [Terriglobia bacterium]|nr:tetratricopeptide repeat protein [Terriglobia bacterium]
MNASKSQTGKRFYEFGPFRIDTGERLLFHQRTPIPLTPKAFDTLLALVENPGHILEKDELMKRVWPDTVVEENNLTQNISALRKALGKNSGENTYIETIPRRGYRFAAVVQESWEEVSRAVVRAPEAPTVAEPGQGERSRRNLWLAIGSILALLVLLVGVYLFRRMSQARPASTSEPPASFSVRPRPSVAVLDLRSLTPQQNTGWLSTALPEMLTSELAAGEQLRAIPGENIARLKLSLPLGGRDGLAPDTLGRIRAILGADYVVLGSYVEQPGGEGGGQIRLDLRLQEARAGETLTAFAETGTEADLFGLVSRAGARLRQALGVAGVPGREIDEVRAELPSSPEVAKLYADGLEKLRAFDSVGARTSLEKAVAADPQFPLAHSVLAVAFSKLGYDAQARAEAEKAFNLSGNLSRQTRLVVEGQYRSLAHQWERALTVYRTLFSLFPDNVDYGIGLLAAALGAGKNDEVQTTLTALRQLPAPIGEDPRIDLAEADWAESISDFKREEVAAVRAENRARALGASFAVARARLAEATALWRLGRSDQALTALAEAQRTFAESGDLEGAASALEETADVLADQGNLTEARKKYEQTLDIRRRTGDDAGVAASLNDVAGMRWRLGDPESARQMFEQALNAYRQVGDQQGVAKALDNIANVAYDQGDLATARRMYDDSAAKFDEIGDHGGRSHELINVALVLYNQGKLAEARANYEQAVKICRDLGTKRQLANALAGLGDVVLQEGNLAQAREHYEQALALRRDLGEKGDVAESQMDLASLAIEDARAADAQAALPAAIEEVHREGQLDDEAYGQAVLARALLEQGKVTEADKAADQAVSLAERSQVRVMGLIAAITKARVDAAAGGPKGVEQAQRILSDVQTQAGEAGFVDQQLQARLAADQILLAADQPDAARADLQKLRKEAREKGFLLIAQKAEVLLK